MSYFLWSLIYPEQLQGRVLLWGWLQERRKVGSYNYAGCLTVPRVLYIRGERLIQEPIPELSKLRTGQGWHHMHLELEEGTSTPLGGVAGPALDIVCTFDRYAAIPSVWQKLHLGNVVALMRVAFMSEP